MSILPLPRQTPNRAFAVSFPKRKMLAAEDSNLSRFIAGFRRVALLPPSVDTHLPCQAVSRFGIGPIDRELAAPRAIPYHAIYMADDKTPIDLPLIRRPDSPNPIGESADAQPLSPGSKAASGLRWAPPPVEEARQLFPNYEVLDLLGYGGMGAVYQARQPALDRVVAIKLLPLEVSVDPAFAERFRREARALAKLSHPNIVTVHDFGQTPAGHLFFVMEFVDGSNLRQLMQRGEIDTPEALQVLLSVCDALAYAHSRGIVHRDIKPANVLVDRQGRVKVADFGLARFTDAPIDLSVTSTGMVMGTPDYMAPEQREGMNVDHRADIYSLGVMLYETLAGEIPKGVFDPLSQRIGTDKRLDQIVSRALSRQPDQRFQSSNELKTAIQLVQPAVVKAAEKYAQQQKLIVSPKRSLGMPHGAIPSDAPTIPNTVFIFPRRRFAPDSPVMRWTIGAALLLAAGAGAWWAFKDEPAKPGIPTVLVATTPSTDTHLPYVNSLGMKFMPVPIWGRAGAGPTLLVSVWETREQDYLAFVNERDALWPMQNFRGSTYPAVSMSWEEARVFCEWLTQKERTARRITDFQRYRLPTDHEWSCAVGIGDREDPGKTPQEKDRRITEVYPWGNSWPPSPGAGNYSGEEAAGHELWGEQKIIPGYRDAFPELAPVGSLTANRFGIYDLGGNVHEWCEDAFYPGTENRVMRGGSFVNDTAPNLFSSYRLSREPGERGPAYGFRVVLEGPLPPAGSVAGAAGAVGSSR